MAALFPKMLLSHCDTVSEIKLTMSEIQFTIFIWMFLWLKHNYKSWTTIDIFWLKILISELQFTVAFYFLKYN